MSRALSIGRLAQAAGVNVETIRFYQRRGLMEQPAKPLGGYRRYAPAEVERIRFIKRAQAVGFTLAEVKGILELDERRLCAGARELALRRLTLIDERMAELSSLRRALGSLLEQCRDGGFGPECPMVQALRLTSPP